MSSLQGWRTSIYSAIVIQNTETKPQRPSIVVTFNTHYNASRLDNFTKWCLVQDNVTLVLRGHLIMSGAYKDVMVISLTLNWSILCFNIVPKLRIWVLNSDKLQRFNRLVFACKHFDEKPSLLARIVTEQILVWGLVILSIVAICVGDVIRHPFSADQLKGWYTDFVEVIFAINIGRYVFTIVEKTFSKAGARKTRFRTDLIHHVVTTICYSFFLFFGENMLLGLVGILIETTSVFDEIGRLAKAAEKDHTVFYRRLVAAACVFNVCFRGVIPICFLVIAMFQQSPFTMNNMTLMVFFLSIIFFSVINVWQILSHIQRFLRQAMGKGQEKYTVDTHEVESVTRRGNRRFKYSKNNLGYCRPYQNKNMAYQIDNEKLNLHNKKATTKDMINLQLDPSTYFSDNRNKAEPNSDEVEELHVEIRSLHNQPINNHADESGNDEQELPLDSSHHACARALRESNSSSDTSNSDSYLIKSVIKPLNNRRESSCPEWIGQMHNKRSSISGERVYFMRSLSAENVADTNMSMSDCCVFVDHQVPNCYS